jgi:hypothetical protein
MNERIKELAEQAGATVNERSGYTDYGTLDLDVEKFAELVRQDEREACAKLCEENERANLYGVKECAKAIRARGEK